MRRNLEKMRRSSTSTKQLHSSGTLCWHTRRVVATASGRHHEVFSSRPCGTCHVCCIVGVHAGFIADVDSSWNFFVEERNKRWGAVFCCRHYGARHSIPVRVLFFRACCERFPLFRCSFVVRTKKSDNLFFSLPRQKINFETSCLSRLAGLLSPWTHVLDI